MTYWERVAASMFPEGHIPYLVHAHLQRIADLTERAGGELRSRQVIAAAIAVFQEAQKP